jgi:hypothetical protein
MRGAVVLMCVSSEAQKLQMLDPKTHSQEDLGSHWIPPFCLSCIEGLTIGATRSPQPPVPPVPSQGIAAQHHIIPRAELATPLKPQNRPLPSATLEEHSIEASSFNMSQPWLHDHGDHWWSWLRGPRRTLFSYWMPAASPEGKMTSPKRSSAGACYS